MSKYEIVTLMNVMSLMGRLRTFQAMQMLQLQMFLRRVQQATIQSIQ